MSGKGDTPRKVNKQKYDENYDRIFGKKDFNKSSEEMVKFKATMLVDKKDPRKCSKIIFTEHSDS